MQQQHKGLINLLRCLIAFLILGVLLFLAEHRGSTEIDPNGSPILYSNVCHDNLEEVFLKTIRDAKQSILLIIYSLNDSKLITALNSQAELGISVKVVHDVTTPTCGFKKLTKKITIEGVKLPGLMHQKILVVDQQKILIGSANLTAESLKLHDNLVIGLINSKLAEAITQHKSFFQFTCGGQMAEYWSFPQKGKEGLKRLIQLIDGAEKTVRIAMFTWTHHALTEAVIQAHKRGVQVEIILDQGQANNVSHRSLTQLLEAGVSVHLSSGLGLLHHKFAWIDSKHLVNGSANWTHAAFTRNHDCLLILHNLTAIQQKKMEEIWKKTTLLYSNGLNSEECAKDAA